jgi:hypothetical protein
MTKYTFTAIAGVIAPLLIGGAVIASTLEPVPAPNDDPVPLSAPVSEVSPSPSPSLTPVATPVVTPTPKPTVGAKPVVRRSGILTNTAPATPPVPTVAPAETPVPTPSVTPSPTSTPGTPAGGVPVPCAPSNPGCIQN